eukprot:gene1393-1996_t
MEVATGPAFTGRMCAASRWIESQRPDSLFSDPLGFNLAGIKGRQNAMGAWILVPRTRFGDDFLIEKYHSNGCRQLVLLGAGMDARAFRLNLPELEVFEIDQQTTFDVKEPLLAHERLTVKGRHALGVDFNVPGEKETWPEKLISAGFDVNIPTVWLLEGLVYYLPNSDFTLMQQQISTLSAPRSALFHDAVSRSYVDAKVVVAGEPFISGSDDYPRLWQKYGFGKNSRAINFEHIRVNRSTRKLDVSPGTSSEVDPARARGQLIVIFFHAEK